jgi:hypothetical protein
MYDLSMRNKTNNLICESNIFEDIYLSKNHQIHLSIKVLVYQFPLCLSLNSCLIFQILK